MNPELKIVTTSDGSKTIYNSEVGENYHSRNGALQESRHVFLNAGLRYFLNKENVPEVSILEVGFGTGLNFLLSADYCTENQISLKYTGIEAFPLSQELIIQTGYNEYISAPVWDSFIGQYQNSLIYPVNINSFCQLQTAHCKLLDFENEARYDVIYFDAFASANQPEMWNEAAIAHTIQFLKPDGVFVTYAITGNLKRIMKSLGLKLKKRPVHPAREKC